MKLRSGYTTGTCATIATRAAFRMIFEQKIIESEGVMTPKGKRIDTKIIEQSFDKISASCAVKKYSGDDPDVTNGINIFAYIKLDSTKREITIDGGIGVGRITKPGLEQKINEPAINKVPRKMIMENARELMDSYGYEGGANIIISVPQGEEIAKKTYNPRLGIVGGISILGTSGIVEPMSEQAIIDTINVELSVKKEEDGDYVMIAPGNYGIDFIKDSFDVDLNRAVKCSNFVGEALDFAKEKEFKGVLLIGHIGKFVKLAGGIMNTHSKNSDSRMEILAANTALYTDNIDILRNIMNSVTTDEALKFIKAEGILDNVMKKIIDKATFYINNRVNSEIETGILMFSNVYGILGKSDNADNMFEHFKGV